MITWPAYSLAAAAAVGSLDTSALYAAINSTVSRHSPMYPYACHTTDPMYYYANLGLQCVVAAANTSPASAIFGNRLPGPGKSQMIHERRNKLVLETSSNFVLSHDDVIADLQVSSYKGSRSKRENDVIQQAPILFQPYKMVDVDGQR